MKKFLALVMAVAMVAALGITTSAAEIPQDGLIAHFTFDNETDGLTGNGATATPTAVVDGALGEGTISISTDAKVGDGALDLAASGSNFLSIAKDDGTSLLTGLDAFTVSFWSNSTLTGPNWNFFATTGDLFTDTSITAQQNIEQYIGILENANINVERYHGGRPSGSNASTGNIGSEWKLITLTMYEDGYVLYVDGVYACGFEEAFLDAVATDGYKVPEILGENSKLFVGYANWAAGEFSSSLVDDYYIWNYAMTEAQVAELATAMGVEGVDVPTLPGGDDDESQTPDDGGDGTQAPADDGTEAPDDGTQAPAGTEAPADSSEGGCGSTLGAAAAIVALCGVFGCAIVKKH